MPPHNLITSHPNALTLQVSWTNHTEVLLSMTCEKCSTHKHKWYGNHSLPPPTAPTLPLLSSTDSVNRMALMTVCRQQSLPDSNCAATFSESCRSVQYRRRSVRTSLPFHCSNVRSCSSYRSKAASSKQVKLLHPNLTKTTVLRVVSTSFTRLNCAGQASLMRLEYCTVQYCSTESYQWWRYSRKRSWSRSQTCCMLLLATRVAAADLK